MTPAAVGWNDEEALDLREAVARIWTQRWWVLASVLVFSLGFIAAALLMSPVYRASVVLVPADADRNGLGGRLGQLGGLASIVGVKMDGAGSETEEAIAVLKSRQFTDAFIKDHNLMPILFAKSWDSATKSWKPASKLPTEGKASKAFRKLCTVIEDKKSGLVTLQIDWTDRKQAAAWANTLVSRLNAEMRSRAITKSDAMLGYLEKELESTSIVGTRQAINNLVESQIKQRMLANVTQEYSFRVVDTAVAPEVDDPIKPKRRLMAAAGFAIGLGIGVIGALLLGAPRRLPGA